MTLQLNPTVSDAYESFTLAQMRQKVFDGMGFIQTYLTTRTETLLAIRNDIYNMLGYAAMAIVPPGTNSMLNSYINIAQQQLYRAIEPTGLLGTNAQTPPAMLVNDTDVSVFDGQAIRQLALGMAKSHKGQEDGQLHIAGAGKFLKDLLERMPPNATTIVNRMLKDGQIELYRQYRVFRMERWFTWTMAAGQRFYSISGNDERAAIPTPTGVAGTQSTTSNYGSMAQTRVQFASVVLNTGPLPSSKVLNVGGTDNGTNIFASAEIFDPGTGLYANTTGSMSVGRVSPMVVALTTGQVLVAGGLNGETLQTAEVFDPNTQLFTLGSNMVAPRRNCQPVRLQNGKVLFAGGQGLLSAALQSAELFDPTTGTFSATGNLLGIRYNYAAVPLNNGKALIAGGFGVADLNTAEVFDPATGTFASAALSFSSMGNGNVGALLANGKAFICGGTSLGVTTANANIYDPVTNTVSGATALPSARQQHTVTLLASGKMLIAGGFDGTNFLATGTVYDPVAGTYAAVSNSMPDLRANHTAVLLTDGTGRVLIAGGNNATNFLATACFYNPATNSFVSSGAATSGVYSYRVAFVDVNGKTTLASTEITTASIPAHTGVLVTWTPPTNPLAKFAVIYGRSAGAELRIAQVDASLGQYLDTITIIPSGALPTTNTTGNVGPILDARELTWFGVSQGDINWRPMQRKIPPQAYTNQTSGIPHWYDIREQIEVWPPAPDSTWTMRALGAFTLGAFEADTDVTTLDWQAVYLYALAKTKAAFNRPDAKVAMAEAITYVGDLVHGTHGTARYIPGRIEQFPVTRPAMTPPLP